MENQPKYIVEFENGGKPWWLANWTGDPGRTCVRVSAKEFKTKHGAEKALAKAIKDWPRRLKEGDGCVVIN
jgi:hypothetical protein